MATVARWMELSERMDAGNPSVMSSERVLPDSIRTGETESRGTDWVEAVSDLVNRLRLEIFGPVGKE